MNDSIGMNIKKFILLFIFINQFLQAKTYIWPTDASHLMSSSFCEYRPGHYHAGLDIKTWAEEGYQVFAIDSGYIKRVLVSPYGYGKAVYLKLNNGWTVVYGHLSRFNDVLEKRIEFEQRKTNRYEQDISFRSTEYPVLPGQLVAFTGKTGIGVPHLHFEVRDESDRPFNPLKLGYIIQDTRPPKIQTIALTPLEYGSYVQGDFIPYIHHFNASNQLSQTPVPVWGKIGIAVSVYDQADGASNRFSPLILNLFIDNSLVFRTEYTSFRYDQTHFIELERDFRLRKWGAGEFQQLYLSIKNPLPFFSPDFIGAGTLKCWYPPYKPIRYVDQEFGPDLLSGGFHLIRVEAEDYWGNRTSENLIVDVKPLSAVIRNDENLFNKNFHNAGTQSLQKTWMHDYIRFKYHSKSVSDDTPILFIWLNGLCQASQPMHRNNFGEWVCVHPLDENFHGTMICQVRIPGFQKSVCQDTTLVFYVDKRGASIYSADYRFFCDIPQDALYEPVWLHIKTETNDPYHSKIYQMITNDIPLKKSVQIRFKLSNDEKLRTDLGIYTSGDGMNYIRSTIDPSKNWIQGNISVFNACTLLRDSVPPVIQTIKPDSGEVIPEEQFAINFTFSDSLSGIYGEDNYCVWIDSVRQIIAYDPEENHGYIEKRSTPDPGMHWFEILICDRVGNETRRKYPFYVVE